ncbi:PREDICTED: probetacellulin isoform X1 [Cyprinodon variegatus]|uniref:Betacellulin n=1 Tax=Cyprinodon variegatus TaxID=28743 RepID=A0A3Q2GBL0_CYPVA|nr:PREDICTED: probetacellulin isoform X1 [Cyprinodon variegatus]
MAKMYRLYVALLTALALWKHCLAEWNTTDGSSACHLHGKMDNCTAENDIEEWNGHFSKCPEELKHYCIHGECRYIKDQETPSCKCQSDYMGARCEYVNISEPWKKNRNIIIGCSITVLLILMILVLSICICSHRRFRLCGQRRRQPGEPKNLTEKDTMLDTSASITADPEIHTNSV